MKHLCASTVLQIIISSTFNVRANSLICPLDVLLTNLPTSNAMRVLAETLITLERDSNEQILIHTEQLHLEVVLMLIK